MIDKRFVDAYDRIELDPESAARIWSKLEQELPPGEEKRSMKKLRNPIRIAVIAAVIAVMLIGSAYAISGVAHSVGTHYMHGSGEFTSLRDLPKVVKTAGYPITAVEEFSNGYSFQKMNLGGEAAFDENNNVLKEYYGVMMTYTKPGARDLTVSVSPVLDLPGAHEAPAPTATRTVDNVELRFSRDHYKFVPEGYEKTEADRAAEKAGHYYISFGADTIMESEYAFVDFTLDGVDYALMDSAADADSEETLYLMAAEIVAAWKA